MKYCPLCKRYVEPVKKFNWALFLLTVWFGVGLIYLLYFLIFKKKDKCPICSTNKLLDYNPENIEARKLDEEQKKESKGD